MFDKYTIGKAIPQSILNKILLTFPFLYHTKIINYESYLDKEKLDHIIVLLDSILKLDGNIIECGSARLGTTIIMANHIRRKNISKKIYACDSFGEGFDKDELKIDKEGKLTTEDNSAFTYTSYKYAKEKIKVLNLSDTIIPIKGFFKKTLHSIDSKFCFCFIDSDLEQSVTYAIKSILPQLEKNGIIAIDDYLSSGFKGVKKAVDLCVKEFRNEILSHGLENKIYYIIKKNKPTPYQ